MSLGTRTRTRLARLRQYPVDLAVLTLAAIAAYVVVTNRPAGSGLRLVATFVLVLGLPGYGLVSVLFPAKPRRGRADASSDHEQRPRGIDTAERIGLSIALSIAIAAMLALVLPSTQWGFQSASTIGGLVVVTIVLAQLGVVRRLRLPRSKRVTVPLGSTLDRFRGEETVRLSAIVLVVAIGIAAGALALAFLSPASAGGFTELGLYSETEDGELVAGELPSEIEPGESVEPILEIDNQEGEDREYTVIVQQQAVEDGEVIDRTPLEEFGVEVADGDTERIDQPVTPIVTPGETVRVSVLLYDEEPTVATSEEAMEETYFWVTGI